ncbi:MAG: hypothetical protein Q9227_003837 [Pyrenula ochraceoflavens]
MKFTEGMWKQRAGVSIDWMQNVERVNINHKKVNLLLNKLQRHRGDTLNSPTISTEISSPHDGVVGVKLVHWDGEQENGPNFDIADSSPIVQVTQNNEDGLKYSSSPLNLAINTRPNELGFLFQGPKSKLTSHSFRSIGYAHDISTSRSNFANGIYMQSQGFVLAAFDLGVGEKLYGLGERFGPFIKNGQSVEVWNEDGGTSSELAYKNIPFYMSSKGYGVFINNPGKVMLELQSERTTRVNIAIEGEHLEYFIIYGENPKDILRRYTALTGRPALPPAWTYGLWLTTSFTTSYSEDTVTGFLDGFRDRNIPLSVFHFDCFYMKSYQWCDFSFDSEMFPDPASYIKRLKERGLKISVWINPYIGQASPIFQEAKSNGYFIMRSDRQVPTVWQWDNWQAGMGIIDFTNPAACEWYRSHLIRMVNLGVDSFKTDFGERIPFKNVRYHNNADPVRMHNYYAQIYNKLVYETLQNHHPRSESCLFARSATAGGQQFPVHWGGDCESTFEAMAESLRGGLSLALCGFGFWAHDIGGFEGTPPPALYKRWVQFGLLSSHSRLHGSSSYRVPWIYGEDCSEVLKECVLRKLTMLPYLLGQALQASRDGCPLLRAMFLEFPRDQNCYTIDTQYMLGSDLLVAPVFTEEGTVTFYVPEVEGQKTESKWRSWFDQKKTYESGKWYTETHDFSTLPILIRPGTAIAINRTLKDPLSDHLSGLELLVNGPLERDMVVEVVDKEKVGEVAKRIAVSERAGELNVSDKTIKVTQL